MRVGIFTDAYYPYLNGVATSIQVLEKELRNLGHEVYIFTSSNKSIKEKNEYVYRLPSIPIAFYKPYRLSIFCPPRVISRIKKMKLDIIHTQTEFSLGILGKIISKIFKIPMVHTYHTMYEKYVHYVANGHLITVKMAKRLSRIFCNRADVIIAPTKKTLLALKAYGVKKPIEVIPTGIDLDQFKKEIDEKIITDLKNKYKISNNDYIVLYVGRVAKEKNIEVLINQMPNILNKISNAKLLIVGGGPVLEDLKKLVDTMNLNNNIIFTGAIPHEDINIYYKLGNVFVITSNTETQGLTYLEAIVSGVPVIVRDDESYKEFIINGENGFIFSNENEIPDIVYKLYSDKIFTKNLILNANKSLDKISSKGFAENVLKAYEFAMNSKKKLKKDFN